MNRSTLALDTRLQRTRGNFSSAVGSDTVILHGDTGVYYALEGIGSFIWDLLAEPISLEAIAGRIVAEYDVGRQEAEADLLEFVRGLLDGGLARIV